MFRAVLIRRGGRSYRGLTWLVGLGSVLLVGCAPAASERPPLVFAAASLDDVLAELGELPHVPGFEWHSAGSEVLLRQVAAGAPADVLVMARPFGPADGESVPPSRPLVETRLVVACRHDAAKRPAGPTDLESLRVAVADPNFAPAGAYARDALRALGLWESLAGNLLRASHVRDACSWVVLGEADVVLCYATDVAALAPLVTCFELGEPKVRYEAAVVATDEERRLRARRVLAAFGTPGAQAVFKRHGFHVDPAP